MFINYFKDCISKSAWKTFVEIKQNIVFIIHLSHIAIETGFVPDTIDMSKAITNMYKDFFHDTYLMTEYKPVQNKSHKGGSLAHAKPREVG